MAIKILRCIQDGSEEEATECDAENQVRHFRGVTGVILHEFSMMIILLLFLQKQNLAFAVYLFGSVLSLPD